ncbi:MAG: class I SAM-dependent methyltransferase [Thermoleophilaceae bacterium]|nr:class I SAM-dependent methyltransferase [Thermoleophilaceae bacterium]
MAPSTSEREGSGGAVRNPLFARLLVRLRRNEPPEHLEYRRELLRGLSGRVLDVGAGDGANFPHFPSSVTEVIAVEPEPFLRERARENAKHAAVPVNVVDALADRLPLEDATVDAAVVALVLCTVPDQAATLRELRRVIRAGGELRFFEHVLARDPTLARVQRVLERSGCWPLVAGGCHPARDTAAAITTAGFSIEACRRLSVKPCPLAFPVAPHILGTARNTP